MAHSTAARERVPMALNAREVCGARCYERIDRPRARLLWEPRGPAWVQKRALALSLCRDLGLVHVVDPFVTEPEPGHPVYWRLHGLSGPRHSYTDAQLQQLRDLLRRVAGPTPAYVMFNNLPRVRVVGQFRLAGTAR